jgi:hypothetical protein
LGDVLANPTHPGRDVHLFLPADQYWSLSTPALVYCFDEADEEPEDVEARSGFRYVLPLSAVAAIVRNVTRQLAHPTPTDLLRAFHYYYDRDAFIDFNTSET